MDETIFMNNPIETSLSRSNDGYEHLLERIRYCFNKAVESEQPMFTTNVENLYDIFLNNLPEEARQHYNCHACRNFVNRYGGLVSVGSDGEILSVMWWFDAPEFFHDAVKAVYEAVKSAKITGVFITSDKRLGIPKTGTWYHMAVDTPKNMIHNKRLFTADQVMAEKKQDFLMLRNATKKYKKETVESAVNLLRSNSLYRSEKILGIAEWFLQLKQHQGNRNFTNMVWKYVATAPAGFCHISSSMIGTLLDDIEEGYDFEAVKRRFDEKMRPTKYQRPQVAPTAQNVARAEKIVAELGIANSLKRRFARLDEIQKVWSPKVEVNKPPYGVFGNIKTKNESNVVKPLFGHGETMTWDKFQRTVLPNARKIELKVGYGREAFSALVTAEDPEAPPIIAWDKEDNRNPFSWYLYASGSHASDWNVSAGNYIEVTGIALLPNLWQPGYEHYGKGVFFILKDCKDKRNTTSGLFPEIMRGELREVRATIEAYSRANALSGDWDADACGICHQSGGTNWCCELKVTTDVGVSLYKLDRWD